MTHSLEGWPTKTKEAPSPHKVGLAQLDTNPIFLQQSSIVDIQLGSKLNKHLRPEIRNKRLDSTVFIVPCQTSMMELFAKAVISRSMFLQEAP